MLGDVTGGVGEPNGHIVGRATLFIGAKNRSNPLRLFRLDKVPQVLHGLIHVHRVDDALSQRATVEQGGIDYERTGFQIFLHQMDHLAT